MKKGRGTAYYTLGALPGIAILLVLFIIPLAFNFSYAFSDGGRAFEEVFTDPYTYRLLLFTLEESLLSAIISVLAALPIAAFFARYSFPGRRAVLTLSGLAFTIPTILVVLGFVIWYGNNGFLNALLMRITGRDYSLLSILYSFKAIILAHVYLNFPIAFLLIVNAWTELPDTPEKAAYTLGAGRLRTFAKVTLPRLLPSVLSAFILIFLFCFSSFSIILVLGGSPAYSTLETEIYRRVHTSVDREGAAALSLFAFAVTGAMLILTSPGRKASKASRRSRELVDAKGRSLLAAAILMLLVLLFILPPMLGIVYRAFFTKAGDFTLRAWVDIAKGSTGLMSTALDGIINSFLIALSSSLAAVAIGSRIAAASAKRNSVVLPVLSSMPMATGSVTLGLGFSLLAVTLGSSSLLLSYLLVWAAHLTIVLPFAVRTITPGAKAIPDSLSLSAYTLGVSEGRTWRKVESPLLAPYRRRAFAFAFALSLGEVNATLTLSEGHVSTLPVLIYRMIGSYNYQGAAALGTLLLAEALIIFAIGEGGRRNAVS